MKHSVLLVDDEQDFLYSTRTLLEDKFQIYEAADLDTARKILAENHIELVLLDITMVEESGLDLLSEIKEVYPEIQVIMVTAVTDTKTAIKAIQEGAYDYILKPYDPEHLPVICERALEFSSLKRQHEGLLVQLEGSEFFQIIGSSQPMKKVFQVIEKVKDKSVTVLISGPTGTGKELVARAIHFKGNRRKAPFIAINCSAIPSDIAESELFGHEKGAFTSADEPQAGKFELADGGTIFLDEINSLDISLQAKILRVIQEKIVTRLGGARNIPVDVRIIAAANQDLRALVESGSFREDLYHRLNVIEIELPSLKKRGKKDLTSLISYFINQYASDYHISAPNISNEALRIFQEYCWPGNIRELQNVIERIMIMEETRTIQRYHIPIEIRNFQEKQFYEKMQGTLKERLADFERQQVLASLDDNELNISWTAKELGMHRTTLIAKLKTLGIDVEKMRN
jgi:DNA-binding NtrC family response regulator